jgi:hypothetical protein
MIIKQQAALPIAFFSHKLTSAQHNYSTIEKELLSDIETLEEYHSILKGAVIRIHTSNNKNLTYSKNLQTE